MTLKRFWFPRLITTRQTEADVAGTAFSMRTLPAKLVPLREKIAEISGRAIQLKIKFWR